MTHLRRKKKPKFQSIRQEHIIYMKKVMKNKLTKDLSIDKKLLLIKAEFPQLSISRSTV